MASEMRIGSVYIGRTLEDVKNKNSEFNKFTKRLIKDGNCLGISKASPHWTYCKLSTLQYPPYSFSFHIQAK